MIQEWINNNFLTAFTIWSVVLFLFGIGLGYWIKKLMAKPKKSNQILENF